MRSIYKYEARGASFMDPDGTVVHVGLDPNCNPCVWLLVDPDAPTVARRFTLVGTGDSVADAAHPVGSFVDGPFVWHVVEVPA